HLRLLGLVAGGSFGFQTRGAWPFEVRAGGGVLVASFRDERRGTFVSNLDMQSYKVGPVVETPTAVYAYASPTLSIGRRFGEHVTVSLFAKGLFLFAASPAEWS